MCMYLVAVIFPLGNVCPVLLFVPSLQSHKMISEAGCERALACNCFRMNGRASSLLCRGCTFSGWLGNIGTLVLCCRRTGQLITTRELALWGLHVLLLLLLCLVPALAEHFVITLIGVK